jgi:NADPH-dependent 2,4-dienoyl-CoA reductase/sulfur reductase-like enzyme
VKGLDIAVVGAGPAGLAAAIEGAKRGCRVAVMDMNLQPGGQLIKQIHKFFGAREHNAGTRGVDIAQGLYRDAREAGVKIQLSHEVYSIYSIQSGNVLETVKTSFASSNHGNSPGPVYFSRKSESIAAKRVILATGGAENSLSFEGWTLPGVMGAGAAQTMSNVWRVLPGKRALMVGAGNVGLIVAYQLLQAGGEVTAVVEAAPRVGGYGVHAAKISRAGAPILTSHTVVRAFGESQVTGAEIARVDESWNPIPGSEREINVDMICIAAGLRPNTRIASLAGCRLMYSPVLGGWTPVHNEALETSVPGIYVAGDAAGIEEASTALDEGRLAGIAAAAALGKGDKSDQEETEAIAARLRSLRGGPFCAARRAAKQEIVKRAEAVCQKD